MKHTLLFAALFAAITTTNAQEQNPEPFVGTANQNKAVVGGWHNFGEMIFTNLGGVDYYRNHLFPDSSVQVEFNSGYGHVWKHSMGQVFDPVDDSWTIGGLVPADATDPYTVDSIRIRYRYFRHQNQNPDTVRVQVITESDMNLYEDPWSNGSSFATTIYDYNVHSALNVTQEFKVLLDEDDTSMVAQRFLELEINQNVPAGEVMGVVVDYLPGNPYNFADTIDQYSSTTPTNQINAFLMYNFNDNNDEHMTGHYNHSWLIPSSIRYNENTQNWNGQYYPGIAYFNYLDHTDIGFHVVGTVGLDENESSVLKVYPNPANDVLHIKASFDISAENLKIKDIRGRDIETMINFVNNSINIATLSNGTYFLSVEKDGVLRTEKFVIAR